MKLIPFELKKIFSGNIKWILLFLLLINTVGYYVYLIPAIPTQRQEMIRGKWEVQLKAYIEGVPSEEQTQKGLLYLSQQIKNIGMLSVYKTDPEWLTKEEKESLQKLYAGSTYMEFNEKDLHEEVMVLTEMEKEYQSVVDYRTFIDGLEERAQRMLKVKIFGDTSFAKKNIEKTMDDFSDVRNIKVAPVNGAAVESLQKFYMTDIFLFIIICLICFQEFGYDHKSGMGGLIEATPKGKGILRGAQMSGVFLATVAVTILLYGSNLIVTVIFSLGNKLDMPVQGISTFRNVSFPCSICMYLALFLILKISAGLFATSFCQLLAVKLSGGNLAWALFGFAIGASFLLWFLIPDTPVNKTFRYLNFVGLLDIAQLLGNYQNLNIFKHPVALLSTAMWFMVILGGIMIICTMIILKTNMHLPQITIPRRNTQRRRVWGSVLYYEFCKLLLNQKVIIVLIGLVILVIVGREPQKEYIGGEEFYYEQYLADYEGSYTKEKKQKLESLYEDRTSLGELQAKGLEQLYEQCRELEEQRLEKKQDNLGIINLNKIRSFFNKKQDEVVRMLILTFALTFSLSSLFYQDQKRDMEQLFCTLPGGRKVYWGKIWLAATLGVLYAAVIWSVPYIQYFLGYGIQGGDYIIQSVPELASARAPITIKDYMIVTIAMRCFIGAYVGVLIAFFTQVFVTPIQNVICSNLIFILPLCLAYVGNMGYENGLVEFINTNLTFAVTHVKVLSGFQRACLSFDLTGWVLFFMLPVGTAFIGSRITFFKHKIS